jgi:ubiquinone/menaquinone biosynthesis C-methylase UbiE
MGVPAGMWQRDEAACRRYESCSVRHLLSPWAPELLARAQPLRGTQVLDLACGTGLIARLAAPEAGPGGRVIGIDGAQSMLTVARSLPVPPGAPIEWRHGDAARLPADDAAFDAVLCHEALQFFPDRVEALREVRRVLRPHGRLAFGMWSCIERLPYFEVLANAVERHLGEEAAAMMRSACALSDPREISALFAAAGFAAAAIERLREEVRLPDPGQFPAEHLASTSLAAPFAALGREPRAALLADIERQLAPYRDAGGGMSVPFEIHVVSWPAHGPGA